jgi:hypothetical protein
VKDAAVTLYEPTETIIGVPKPRGIGGQVHVDPVVVQYPNSATAKFGETREPAADPNRPHGRQVEIGGGVVSAPDPDEVAAVDGSGYPVHRHPLSEELSSCSGVSHLFTVGGLLQKQGFGLEVRAQIVDRNSGEEGILAPKPREGTDQPELRSGARVTHGNTCPGPALYDVNTKHVLRGR